MSVLSFKVENAAKVIAFLKGIDMKAAVMKAIDEMTKDVQALIAVYPRAGDYNEPGPYPKKWYQRNVGPRWARKNGTIGGRNISQRLQNKWKRRMMSDHGEVYNTASYAPYVQSQEKQASFHKAHGWQTDEDVLRDYQPKAMDRVQKHVHDALEGKE